MDIHCKVLKPTLSAGARSTFAHFLAGPLGVLRLVTDFFRVDWESLLAPDENRETRVDRRELELVVVGAAGV